MIHSAACRTSDALAKAAGSVWAVYVAILACAVAWVIFPPTDPFNSLVSDVSLVMLFVLQRSGNRDTSALQTKADEMIHALPDADDKIAGIERD